MNDDELFLNFLAAYMDCEGNWHLTKSHEIHSRYVFRLRAGDERILIQINSKLKYLGFGPLLFLSNKKGA